MCNTGGWGLPLARACKWHQSRAKRLTFTQPPATMETRTSTCADGGGWRWWRLQVFVMHEFPCDKQVSAWHRGINSTVHQLTTTSHVISWILGLYPRSWARTWPSVPVGRAPGRLRSPDGAPSDLISPPLCISPQSPPTPPASTSVWGDVTSTTT